jgi:hypothetical protein
MRKDGDFEKSSPKTKQGSKVSWELELWGSEVAGGWNFQLRARSKSSIDRGEDIRIIHWVPSRQQQWRAGV